MIRRNSCESQAVDPSCSYDLIIKLPGCAPEHFNAERAHRPRPHEIHLEGRPTMSLGYHVGAESALTVRPVDEAKGDALVCRQF